jgi:RNA polymerase sigma-70 factor, ECF subfamily
VDVVLRDIENLYRTDFVRFLRVATAIVGDQDAGRDAVQEGFADAIRSRARYRPEGQLGAWVWAAVVNAARTAATRTLPTPTAEIHVSTNGAAPADLSVSQLVASLPERQRLALFLRYYADLDYRAISRVLGVEVGTVSATLNHAHAAIRRALDEVPR